MAGVLLCDDLLFGSRVRATAAAHGLPLTVARSAAAVGAGVGGVLADLALPGLDLPALVAAVRTLNPRPTVVAFGSHVDAAGLRAAREAGCDLVLPRSAFAERLETDLPQWLRPAPADEPARRTSPAPPT